MCALCLTPTGTLAREKLFLAITRPSDSAARARKLPKRELPGVSRLCVLCGRCEEPGMSYST